MNRRQRRALQFAAGQPSVSAEAAKPIQTAPVVEEEPNTVVVRTAAVSMVLPTQVWQGRLTNPDAVLRQFGGQYGIAFYRLMMQQNLGLSADCSQWEDRTNAEDPVIRAGDPDSEISRQMAKDCTRAYKRIPSSNIVNLWILRARWYGLGSFGKAGWKKVGDVLAPLDVYNIDPWRWKFGPNFEPYLLTGKNQYNGDRTDDRGVPWERSVFFARWGSLFTAYGESDLRDVYLSCWYTQNVQEMLLQSIERLGRPIPWIEVGDGMSNEEFTAFEAAIALQYEHYVITQTPNAHTQTTFPNITAVANGGIGKSEQDFIRYHAGLISRKILGSQQTQDKVGGSRALEETRLSIANDKTPPGLQLRDQAWTEGWLNDISLVNWPNQPREMWPVMDSDRGDHDAEPLSGAQLVALAQVAEQLRLKQITKTWAIKILVRERFRRLEAEEMVESMTDPKAGLSEEPSTNSGTTAAAVGATEIFDRREAAARQRALEAMAPMENA